MEMILLERKILFVFSKKGIEFFLKKLNKIYFGCLENGLSVPPFGCQEKQRLLNIYNSQSEVNYILIFTN